VALRGPGRAVRCLSQCQHRLGVHDRRYVPADVVEPVGSFEAHVRNVADLVGIAGVEVAEAGATPVDDARPPFDAPVFESARSISLRIPMRPFTWIGVAFEIGCSGAVRPRTRFATHLR